MSSQEELTSGYILASAILESNRIASPLELKNVISDFEIFEHLDQPYITAQVAVVDDNRLFDRIDIQGHEQITLSVQKSLKDDPVERKFVIDKITNSSKSNQETEVIILHLIDYDTYKSNLLNVNKAYSGNAFEIANKILKQYMNTTINNLCESIIQTNIKVIIPNLTPLSAVAWLKNRITTIEGLPTYVYRSYGEDDLNIIDLNKIITQPPINTETPFLYGLTDHHTELTGFHHVQINEYSLSENEDMYDLIQRGLVGSKYEFYDVMSAQYQEHKFNVAKDAFDMVAKNADEDTSFSDQLQIDDIALQDYSSRTMTSISSSGAYDDGTNRFKSYDEEVEASHHTKKIISRSLKHFLTKTSLSIRVNGQGFLDKNNATIGRKVRILFLANRPASDGGKLDLKKSGDYIVYSCKHSFTTTRYDIHLKCVKIRNFKDDSVFK